MKASKYSKENGTVKWYVPFHSTKMKKEFLWGLEPLHVTD